MIVQLKSFRNEKQYQDYYKSGLLDTEKDTTLLHKNNKDLHKTYTAAWIKLLSENIKN